MQKERESAGTVGGCNNLKHRTYGIVTQTIAKNKSLMEEGNYRKLENS